MRVEDVVRFSIKSLSAYPARTALILLAMVISIASVIILTSLGEGARLYVTGQFRSLGSHLLFVLPGRTETTGGMPPIFGTAPHDLTIADSVALTRSVVIERTAPIMLGVADVSYDSKEREVTVIGSSHDLKNVFELKVARGRFLPDDDIYRADRVCVLGEKLHKELFGYRNVVGEWVRIGNYRFRIIGILAPRGASVGIDMSDAVMIPTPTAQMLFDRPALFRIIVKAKNKQALPRAEQEILDTIRMRHGGEADITIIRQDAMIGTFDNILKTLTWAVGAIAAISLIVAGILIMNVMMVSVSQRKSEIGLLRALGAPTHQVMRIFLSEALILSLSGGVLGLILGLASVPLIHYLIPDFSPQTPAWSIVAALATAIATGLIFGSIPALKAAKLDPVTALSGR